MIEFNEFFVAWIKFTKQSLIINGTIRNLNEYHFISLKYITQTPKYTDI